MLSSVEVQVDIRETQGMMGRAKPGEGASSSEEKLERADLNDGQGAQSEPTHLLRQIWDGSGAGFKEGGEGRRDGTRGT